MSDMIINDSVPVDKKWSELIRYNIFIMKLVEFGISLFILCLPVIIPKPQGHMYCIATGPTTVISMLFVILYLRQKVPLFMEKMYLVFQIFFTFGAFIQCFLLNLVISLMLMIIPFILSDAGVMHCLAVAPTLVLSLMFIVLYLVDQVHVVAEQLYLSQQITLTVAAFVFVLLGNDPTGAVYGLFYCHLLIALCIDIYYGFKERGMLI
ncbi:unnamed protein product [Pieris macdunnoughi]|uniref:Uncharacterized protein n=1 Tax=Pieris macdunnoughi TaxID=345717 RepID=A0A821QC47_9NEOP|nr:unnamed protein product [Pieris macdunnoughi]